MLGNSFFGLSFLFSKVALERLEPFALLAVRFIVAFVGTLLAIGPAPPDARLRQRLQESGVWGSVFYLVVFSSVGAFFLLNYAFSYLNLAQASIFTNLVTLVSIAAGIVYLGESFTALQRIGSIAILTGVYLSNHMKGRTE